MNREMAAMIRDILHELRFPAEKWQIVTYADDYGLDAASCEELWALPLRHYRDPAEVANMLASHRPE
jgi:hypothetical protein